MLAIGPRKHDVQPWGSRRRLVKGPISIPQATRSASAGTDFRTTPQAVSLLGPWEEKRGPAPLHRPGRPGHRRHAPAKRRSVRVCGGLIHDLVSPIGAAATGTGEHSGRPRRLLSARDDLVAGPVTTIGTLHAEDGGVEAGALATGTRPSASSVSAARRVRSGRRMRWPAAPASGFRVGSRRFRNCATGMTWERKRLRSSATNADTRTPYFAGRRQASLGWRDDESTPFQESEGRLGEDLEHQPAGAGNKEIKGRTNVWGHLPRTRWPVATGRIHSVRGPRQLGR